MKYCFLRYPGGKTKAVTFSYDDGNRSDLRLLDILDKYGMKVTLNICGANLDDEKRITPTEIVERVLNKGHEIANHGNTHTALGITTHTAGIRDVLDCRINLERRFDRLVRGFAYPDTMRNIKDENYLQIKSYLKQLGILYARLCGSDSDRFDLPTDFYAWMPNAHHDNPEIFNYVDKFLALDVNKMYSAARHPRLLYIWGHSAEFEQKGNLDRLEKICQALADNDDIWYATNMEIYEYVTAYNSLVFYADNSAVYNPTRYEIFLFADGVCRSVKPYETLRF